MTSKNKHMQRSHRSYASTMATLGSYASTTQISRDRKLKSSEMAVSVFTSITDRLKNLSKRLSERFSQNYRKQDR